MYYVMEFEIGTKVYEWDYKNKKRVVDGVVKSINQTKGTYVVYDSITNQDTILGTSVTYEYGRGPYDK